MIVMYEFLIWETYGDQAPEPFGNQFFENIPKVGDIIELYWLNKEFAYKKEVISVDLEKKEIWTRSCK